MDTHTVERTALAPTPAEQQAADRLAARVNEQFAPMLTADEASAILRVRTPQVYALARDGVIPSVRVGRAVRFNRDQLMRWIENGGAPARTLGTEA